jgi:hypothetical protein
MIVTFCSLAAAGGKSTYDFLRNDVGARSAAMGGSFVAMTNDPNIIFYNPAGLGTVDGRKISVGFFKHLLDINAGYASVATEIPGLGHVGAGVVYTNYGEFKRTGEEGQDLGTFGAGEFALTAGYGGTLSPGLLYGANVTFIYSSIGEYNSSGAAVDLGVQYDAVPGRVRLAASILHLGTQFDPYGATNERLPLDVNIGAALTPEHLPATIMVHLHKLNEDYESVSDRFKAFSVGTEFTLSPNLFLRLGYNHERRQELKVGQSSGLAGFSIGGGIMTEMYGIDYAFNSYGTIGALHRISIAFY